MSGKTVFGRKSRDSVVAARKHFARRAKLHRAAVLVEPLEQRQLLSLTIDIRASDGIGKSATVANVGDVLHLQLWATITGSNDDPTQDGLQFVSGSLISNELTSNSVAGNILASNFDPFTANGAIIGMQADLNGQGNLDIGSNDPQNTDAFFVARSGGAETVNSSGAQISTDGHSLEFEIGRLTYTVTNLNSGGETDLTFRPRDIAPPTAFAAIWDENDAGQNNVSSVFQGGAAFVVTDPTVATPPSAPDQSFNIAENDATDVNELANDTSQASLDPTSVTITSPTTHGTTVIQSDGTILYTPNNSFTGTDSFVYTVKDVNGLVSNPATITLNVVAPVPPTAGSFTSTALFNTATTIDVLSHDSSGSAGVDDTSVAITHAPAHGTAVLQSNGSIVYTPSTTYNGPDSLSYTVKDTNGVVSNVGTVTINVTIPPAPLAANITQLTQLHTPVDINVFSSDETSTGTAFDPAGTLVVSAATHGTAVPQSDGSILYTPDVGYTGTDSFSYQVADTDGEHSNTAIVSMTIVSTPPPVATNDSATTLIGQAININVLANDTASSPETIVASSTVVTTNPTHGTAVVQTDGSVEYTPSAGFVGADSFNYTVDDSTTQPSNTAAVTINVGTSISNIKGANHTLTYTDASGAISIISLNRGTANIYFTGTATLAATKAGRATVTGDGGTGLTLSSIALTGTTNASVLVIHSRAGDATLGGLTNSGPMNAIIAPATNLVGTLNVNGLNTLQLGPVNSGTITIGAGRPNAAVLLGAVTNSNLTSSVPMRLLKAASWTNTTENTITVAAPSIGTLLVAGTFEPNLTLSGAARGATLAAAVVNGTVDAGFWTVSGLTHTIVLHAVTSGWNGNVVGALNAMVVRTGGFASGLKTGALGAMTVFGTFSGGIDIASATVIHVVGDLDGATIQSAGNIQVINARAITNSIIDAGVVSGTTLTNASSSNLGSAAIRVVHGTSFADSVVLASTINVASIGTVTTDNAGTAEGLAALKLLTVATVFSNKHITFGPKQLKTAADVTAFETAKSVTPGDFAINVAT